MKAVFLTKNKNSCESVYTPETRARLSEKLEFLEPVYTTEALAARENELRDVEIIFSTWGMFSLTSEEIARYFPNLRAVFYGAGSVQYFARPFIEAGIKVFSAWAANAVPVAEYTVAQIILANKGYFQRFHRAANSGWVNRSAGGYFTGNYNNKVGLIGIGMIGSMVAEGCTNTSLRCSATTRFCPTSARRHSESRRYRSRSCSQSVLSSRTTSRTIRRRSVC